MPSWYLTLVAAKEWNVPPWVLAGDGNKWLWWYRWKYINQTEAKASRKS